MYILGYNIYLEVIRLGFFDISFNILIMDGRSGVWYYSNVIVYIYFGIYCMEFFDGFVFDFDLLIKGVVYDGLGDVNYLFLLLKSGILIYVKFLYVWISILCI